MSRDKFIYGGFEVVSFCLQSRERMFNYNKKSAINIPITLQQKLSKHSGFYGVRQR